MSTLGKLKYFLDHSENQLHNLWFLLVQYAPPTELLYKVKSVGVGDISELAGSIPTMHSQAISFSACQGSEQHHN